MTHTREEIESWAAVGFRLSQMGNEFLFNLVEALESGGLLVPDYQRPRVWTGDQKAAWCGFVLSGAPLPSIYIREVDGPTGPEDEVVDGQQRLLAVADWLARRVPACLHDGREVWCSSDLARMAMGRRIVPTCRLPPTTTRRQAIEIYLSLNGGGTAHTEAELHRAKRLMLEARDV